MDGWLVAFAFYSEFISERKPVIFIILIVCIMPINEYICTSNVYISLSILLLINGYYLASLHLLLSFVHVLYSILVCTIFLLFMAREQLPDCLQNAKITCHPLNYVGKRAFIDVLSDRQTCNWADMPWKCNVFAI